MPELIVPFVTANIGRGVPQTVAVRNIKKVRHAFPHRNPLVGWQEIDEADTPDEHLILSKTFAEPFFNAAFKYKEPVSVPKESFVIDHVQSVKIMDGVPKKSPTRYAHKVYLHPQNALEKTFVAINTHLANFDVTDPRWIKSVALIQKEVDSVVDDEGFPVIWMGDTNANFPKNMQKVHPKEKRVVAKGNDYLGIIQPAKSNLKITVKATGSINLTIDGHNAQYAMLGFK